MTNDQLISLVDCQPENLVWVSGWYVRPRRRTGWHLYQFGLPPDAHHWRVAYPAAMPLCRAPGFRRAEHAMWKKPPESQHDDYVVEAMAAEPTSEIWWCHRCIIWIVERHPYIFEKGGNT